MKKPLRNLLLLLPLLLLVVVDGITLAQAIATPEMEHRASIITACAITLLASLWVGGGILRVKSFKSEELRVKSES